MINSALMNLLVQMIQIGQVLLLASFHLELHGGHHGLQLEDPTAHQLVLVDRVYKRRSQFLRFCPLHAFIMGPGVGWVPPVAAGLFFHIMRNIVMGITSNRLSRAPQETSRL